MNDDPADAPGAAPAPGSWEPADQVTPGERPAWQVRLATTLLVVVAAAAVGLFIMVELRGDDDKGGPDASGTTATATPTRSPSASASAQDDDGLPRDTDGNIIPPPPAPPPPSVSGRESALPAAPGARETAEGFGRAFTNVSGGQTAWFNRLAPFLTPEKAAEYRVVPIDALPSGALAKADVQTPGNRVAKAVLTYDSGLVLDVTLAHNGEKWQVTKVDRSTPNVGSTS